MKVFVTGATGFIVTALMQELINAGYQVLGLTRLEASAQADRSRRGCSPWRSAGYRKPAAAQASGIIHAGFIHGFTRVPEFAKDTRSIAHKAAAERFGWFAHMAPINCPASSRRTQQQLNWHPTLPYWPISRLALC